MKLYFDSRKKTVVSEFTFLLNGYYSKIFQLITFYGFVTFTLLSLDQGIHNLGFEIVLSVNCMFTQIPSNHFLFYKNYLYYLIFTLYSISTSSFFKLFYPLFNWLPQFKCFQFKITDEWIMWRIFVNIQESIRLFTCR